VVRVFWSLFLAWKVTAATNHSETENAAGGKVLKFVIAGKDRFDAVKIKEKRWILQAVAGSMLEHRRCQVEVEVLG